MDYLVCSRFYIFSLSRRGHNLVSLIGCNSGKTQRARINWFFKASVMKGRVKAVDLAHIPFFKKKKFKMK